MKHFLEPVIEQVNKVTGYKIAQNSQLHTCKLTVNMWKVELRIQYHL
jgi:hypothetical protein